MQGQIPKMAVMSSIEIPKEFLHKKLKSRMYKEFLAIMIEEEESGDQIIFIY